MVATLSPSDRRTGDSHALSGVRTHGGVSLCVEQRRGRSVVTDIGEQDGYKIRMPRGSAQPEAVIINTGGGLLGGDRVRQHVSVGEGAQASVTTQACERVYRALGKSVTKLDIHLSLGGEAQLNWLPQETILFNRSRLARSITVEMAGSAHLLLAECLILGRTAMGEMLETGQLTDLWRIRRNGELVFADTVRLDGEIARTMSAQAVAGGAHVIATIMTIRPYAEDWLQPVRKALDGVDCDAGASAWNGMLIVRALGRSSQAMRRMLGSVLPILSGAPLPRVWQS